MSITTSSHYSEKLWQAVFNLQSEMPIIVQSKEANTGKYSFSYANLASVWEKLQPLLKKHGLLVIQGAKQDTVTTRVMHVATGEWYEATSPLFVTLGGSTKDTYGSQTLARRYGVMTALFLIATKDDDDARLAHETQRRAQVGYMDDAIGTLIKRGMDSITATQRVKEEVGEQSPNDISRDGWLDIVQRLSAEIPAPDDPILNGEDREPMNPDDVPDREVSDQPAHRERKTKGK